MFVISSDDSAVDGAFIEDDSVSVTVQPDQFEGGYDHRCSECGDRVDEEGIDELGERDCTAQTDNPDYDPDAPSSTEPEFLPHQPVEIPLSWVNHAGVEFNAERDQVDLHISLGDPRGAFVFRVYRAKFTDHDGNEVDELRMELPYAGAGLQHMDLEPLDDRPGSILRIKR